MTHLAALRSTVAAMEAVLAVRAGKGNPNHDALGKFAASAGTHHKRKLRELRERHRAERAGQGREHRAEHRSLGRQHSREARSAERRHAARLARHEATAPARHAAIDAGHAAKSARIARGEAKATAVSGRHARERAEFDAAGGRGHLHEANERIYEQSRQTLKAKGGTPDEHAALEAKIAEHKAKFADPHAGLRKVMDERHAAEHGKAQAFLGKSPGLRDRLARQTAAKHARVDRTPARLDRRRQAEHGEMQGRHAEERGDLEAEHGGQRRQLERRHLREWKRAGGSVKAKAKPDIGTAARSLSRTLPSGRTHKAGSAESILRHCLRSTGLTAAWKADALTGEQALEVLEAVRQYGRAWLRHEAEQLFRVHGQPARALTDAVRYHVGRFFSRAKQFTRELILAGTMALHGPEPLESADLVEADRQAQAQAEFYDKFERDTVGRTPPELEGPRQPYEHEPPPGAPGPISLAEFVARAESYGASAWGAAQEIERRGVIRRTGGAILERREHEGGDRPCPQCVDEANKGWQPPGTLLPIGFCICLQQCHCHFEFKGSDGRVWAVGSRRVKAA